eukprot:244154-Ditylum_brightwellii.AAC.1
MKIDHKGLEFANQNVGNKPLPISFYVLDNKKKLNPLEQQRLWQVWFVKDAKEAHKKTWPDRQGHQGPERACQRQD